MINGYFLSIPQTCSVHTTGQISSEGGLQSAPQGILLKIFLIAKTSLFMHVVLPHASQTESDGAGFCNCTVQQSLFCAMDSVPG